MTTLHADTLWHIASSPDLSRELAVRLAAVTEVAAKSGVEHSVLESVLDTMAREFAERPPQPDL